jgi:hypothetical protein
MNILCHKREEHIYQVERGRKRDRGHGERNCNSASVGGFSVSASVAFLRGLRAERA